MKDSDCRDKLFLRSPLRRSLSCDRWANVAVTTSALLTLACIRQLCYTAMLPSLNSPCRIHVHTLWVTTCWIWGDINCIFVRVMGLSALPHSFLIGSEREPECGCKCKREDHYDTTNDASVQVSSNGTWLCTRRTRAWIWAWSRKCKHKSDQGWPERKSKRRNKKINAQRWISSLHAKRQRRILYFSRLALSPNGQSVAAIIYLASILAMRKRKGDVSDIRNCCCSVLFTLFRVAGACRFLSVPLLQFAEPNSYAYNRLDLMLSRRGRCTTVPPIFLKVIHGKLYMCESAHSAMRNVLSRLYEITHT